MKMLGKVMLAVIIAAAVMISSIFLYNIFFGKSPPQPPRRQIAFVNCTYYIYPNETYGIVNITKVIRLENVDLKMNYFRLLVMGNITANTKINIRVVDKDGLLSEGDQFFVSVHNGNITRFMLCCEFHGKTKNGEEIRCSQPLWDSKYGPMLSKAGEQNHL